MSDEYYDIGEETFVLPDGFTFKPAHGKLNKDGSVTVSGYNFTQQDIQEAKEWREVVDILKAIKGDTDDGFIRAADPSEL